MPAKLPGSNIFDVKNRSFNGETCYSDNPMRNTSQVLRTAVLALAVWSCTDDSGTIPITDACGPPPDDYPLVVGSVVDAQAVETRRLTRDWIACVYAFEVGL